MVGTESAGARAVLSKCRVGADAVTCFLPSMWPPYLRHNDVPRLTRSLLVCQPSSPLLPHWFTGNLHHPVLLFPRHELPQVRQQEAHGATEAPRPRALVVARALLHMEPQPTLGALLHLHSLALHKTLHTGTKGDTHELVATG